MIVFGHHAKAFIDLEIMGYELTPNTATEHLVALVVVGVILGLMVYGGYAAVRDLFRWRRHDKVAG